MANPISIIIPILIILSFQLFSYYTIQYTLYRQCCQPKSLGLLALFDTMRTGIPLGDTQCSILWFCAKYELI